MTEKKLKEVGMVSLSFGNFTVSLKKVIPFIKKHVKRFFKWVHIKLTNLEDRILLKLDEIGTKAMKKLEERLIIKEPIVE